MAEASTEISEIMTRLNAMIIDADTTRVAESLSQAWSALYDARATLEVDLSNLGTAIADAVNRSA